MNRSHYLSSWFPVNRDYVGVVANIHTGGRSEQSFAAFLFSVLTVLIDVFRTRLPMRVNHVWAEGFSAPHTLQNSCSDRPCQQGLASRVSGYVGNVKELPVKGQVAGGRVAGEASKVSVPFACFSDFMFSLSY